MNTIKAWIKIWELKKRLVARFFGFRKKRQSRSVITKYFYLNEGDIAYRIARDHLTRQEYERRLDIYYPQLVSVSESENSSLRVYFVVTLACVLAHYGAISEVSSFGIKISITAIKQVLLFALSSSVCAVGVISAKRVYLRSLFDRYAQSKNPHEKADLLARYPRAFVFSHYYVRAIGGAPYLTQLTIPWQMVLLLMFLAAGLVLYVAFTIWIFVVTAIDVWGAPAAEFGGWSRILVLVSAGLAGSAYLMPSSYFKRRYTHLGMVDILTKTKTGSPQRYARYIGMIRAAAKSMKLDETVR